MTLSLTVAAALCSSPVAAEPSDGCFWVDGRLSIYNGTPSVRIWPKGTDRLLGVVTPSGDAEGEGLLPAEVERLKPAFDRDVWGRFRVCPVTDERPGGMRKVFMVRAEGLRAAARP